jgi:hypothetical protein
MQLANTKRDLIALNNKMDIVLIFLEEFTKTYFYNSNTVEFEGDGAKFVLNMHATERFEQMIERMSINILNGSPNIIDKLYLSKTVEE